MDVLAHSIHFLKMIIDICATLHEVIVEVEVPIAILVLIDTILIPLVVDVVIMVHLVMVIVVPQMIFMEQV